MVKEIISLQDAADLSNKSIQTIRRAVKSKKIKFKRAKTPQGFNYLIEKDSLITYYGLKIKSETIEEKPTIINFKTPKVKIEKNEDKNINFVTAEDIGALSKALERMVNQHSEERQSFLRLINTQNDRIFVLENQLKLLQAPKKKWYSFSKK